MCHGLSATTSLLIRPFNLLTSRWFYKFLPPLLVQIFQVFQRPGLIRFNTSLPHRTLPPIHPPGRPQAKERFQGSNKQQLPVIQAQILNKADNVPIR